MALAFGFEFKAGRLSGIGRALALAGALGLAASIADVLCGGDVDAGTLVDEQWFLDLERRHFMELVGHPKSQERMMGLMQTGKPVRN